ncbi:Alkaline phosphatase [Rhodovulum sp. P5]|uniref:beta strand repeat-containing protein n=1 Tax=Rhodovulum sp. P5 TaxID=1564506 RepID=UPI0009C28BFB|nr:calcium-binding protein [Rhodovulum sp. P5]ARE39007.1 Alkaline phosphatase [Rhodovulum sp. P5]
MGAAGDDTLTGGAGDDTLIGAGGSDTAIFSGDRDAYTITDNGDGTYTVDGPDGTDLISGIETLVFDDGSHALADALNHAPTDIALSASSVTENDAGATVGTLTVTDPDSWDSVSWSVDDARFEVVGDTLKLKAGDSLDYEAGNVTVTVTATDGEGASYDEAFTITVGDVAEDIALADGGVAFSDAGVAETSITGGTGADTITAHGDGGDLSGGDGADSLVGAAGDDTLTGGSGDDTLIGAGGTDTAIFSGNRDAYTITDNGDGTYTVDGPDGTDLISGIETLVFDDGSHALADALNHAPTDIALSASSVTENDAGATVGTLTVTDPDSWDSVAWSVDDARFEVVGDTLKLKAGDSLDYEAGNVTVTVTATDGEGATYDEAFTITVGDVAEDLTLADGGVSFTDAGVAETSITGGTGDDTITAHGDGGDLSGGAGVDSLIGAAGDDTLTGGSGDDTLIGAGGSDTAIFSGDRDQYTITDNGDGTYTVDGPDGTDLISGIETLVFDDGSHALADALNHAPTDIALSASSVTENDAGATVGTLTVTDPDSWDSVTWSVDDARFEVVGDTLKLKAGDSLDYEAGNVTVTVTATDGEGATYDEAFTITVGDVAEDLTLADGGVAFTDAGVAETSITGGTGADTITAHDDGGDIAGGAGADSLIGAAGDDTLTGGAGDDTLIGAGGSDTAIFSGNRDAYTITDNGDGTYTVDGPDGTDLVSGIETLVFDDGSHALADALNHAPTDIALSASSVTENDAGATVGTLTVTDPDSWDSVAWSVDDARFEVVGDTLKLKAGDSLDYEAGNVTVTVTATDGEGVTYDEAFTITVGDVAEDLALADGGVVFTDAGVAETSITGGTGDDTITAHADGGDIDGGAGADSLVGAAGDDTLTGGAGDDTLIGAGGSDTAIFSGNRDAYTITDNGDGTYTVDGPDGTDLISGIETLVFDDGSHALADAINHAPTDIALSASSVTENDAGATVGTLTVTDPDSWDSVSWSVDDARFEVVGNTLKLKAGDSLDYEAGNVTVTVTATDSEGATYDEAFTITVGDVAEDITLADGGVSFTDAGVAETSITGGTGDDTITAHADGGDLSGGAGADSLVGAAGDDTLTGGAGDDTLEGAGGSDTAIFSGNRDAYTITDNGDGTYTVDGPDGTDLISGIETLVFDDGSHALADALNHAPTDIALSASSVTENDAGASIGTLTVTDPDSWDSVAWSVDDARFEVVGDTLKLKAGDSLDYEAGNVTVTVTATDGEGATYDEAFTITVGDVAEDLTLADGGVAFTDIGVAETSITGGTGDDTITAHADGGDIDGGAGADSLIGAAGDDTLTGGAGDDTLIGAGGSDSAIFSGDRDAYTITDNGDGTYTVDGPDGTDLVSGIETLVFDDGSHALADALNHAPTDIALSASSVTENDAGAPVGALTVTDPDSWDSVSWSVDDARFEVVGDTLKLKAGDSLDYEAGNVTVTVTATDGEGATYDEAFTITVGDVAEDLALADGGVVFTDAGVAETSITGGTGDDTITAHADGGDIDGGAGADSLVGAAGDDTLTGGAGDDTIAGGDGTDTAIFSGNRDAYTITDNGDGTYTVDGPDGTDLISGIETLVFDDGSHALADALNHAPTDIALSASSVTENDAGATVGTLTVTDPDSWDSVAWSVDDARFEVVGDTLKLKAGDSLDYEAGNVTVTVTATDGEGATYDEAFTITVGDVAEDLALADGGVVFTDAGVAETSITGGTGDDTITAHADGGDIDGGAGADSLVGAAGDDTLTGGAGDDTLIGAGGSDTAIFSGNRDQYTITDNGDGTYTVDGPDGTDLVSGIETLVFDDGSHALADALNHAPTDIALSASSVTENDAGATVGTLTVTDPDSWDSVAWSVDDARFEVVGDTLKLKDTESFDYETDPGTVTVTVTATDGEGATYDESFTITLEDAAEVLTVDASATAFTDAGVTELSITGDTGDDTIVGSDGDDNLYGASGDDSLVGGTGDDVLDGADPGRAAGAHALDGFTFDYSEISAGGGQNVAVGDYVVYDNVGVTDDGITVQAKITLVSISDPDMKVDLGNASGFQVYLNRNNQSDAGETAEILIEFFDQDTGEVVKLDSAFTFKDIDDPEESVTISKEAATTVSVSKSPATEISVTDLGDDFQISSPGATGGLGVDEEYWATVSFDGLTSMAMTVTSRGGGTGYAFETDEFSAPVEMISVTNGGADTLEGGDDNDTLTGGVGNDVIYGGAGLDTAVYSGDLSDYDLVDLGGGAMQITDLRAIGGDNEGTDMVYDVETFVFNGTSYVLADISAEAAALAAANPIDAEAGTGSVYEDAVAGTIAVTVSTTGENGEATSYFFTDAGGTAITVDDFEFVGAEIWVKAGATLDYETASSQTYYFRGTDGISYTPVTTVTIGIDDVAEDITLADGGVNFTDTGVAETSITGGTGNDTITAHADGGDIDGGAGADSIIGGAGVDTLVGGSGNDTIEGGDGDDTIDGGTGNDSIAGGAGDDRFEFSGAWGVDTVFGDEWDGTGTGDNDVLDFSAITSSVNVAFTFSEDGTATSGANSVTFENIEGIIGGTANDTIDATADISGLYLDGGDGADSILGGDEDDTIYGGAGNDTIFFFEGDNVVYGGDGDDSLDDEGLVHDSGNDYIDAGTGNDTVYSGYGMDTIIGGTGNDAMYGEEDEDTFIIENGFGFDTIRGGESVSTGTDWDVIDASAVTDDLTVSFSNDTDGTLTDGSSSASFYGMEALRLGSGDDVFNGNANTTGVDISGGDGNDTINGASGDDTIDGGSGSDVLSGGDGSDVFYAMAAMGDDTIAGGSGVSWTDIIDLGSAGGTATVSGQDIIGDGWVATIDGGSSILSDSDGVAVLSQDAAGTIVFDGGGTVSFTGIEQLNW